MSYLPENFDNFQESIINGGYDPRVVDNHPVAGGDDWMFGCDVCQDVCPWNRFSKPHNEPLFNPHPELLSMTKNDWEDITQDVFNKLFKNSAVKRTKFSGLQRNISFLKD